MGTDFERLAARFVGAAASFAPQDIVSLIFSSSVSVRSPDASCLWHSGYRRRHPFKLFLQLLIASVTGLLKGLIRIARPPQFGYGLYGTIKDSILIVTSECGYATAEGGYKTRYVDTDEDDALLVIGPVQQCGDNAKQFVPVSAPAAVRLVGIMMFCGIRAFFRVSGSSVSKTLILLEWYSWAFSLQWQRNFYLQRILSDVIGRYPIKKIGCIHEMHSYARVVWRFASKHGIKTYTVQHASMSSDKRWYFPYPEEMAQGLVLPDVFYAFEERVVRLLMPYFPKTVFLIGCSCRYSQWKSVEPRPVNKENGYYLFVAGLARFDNEAVIGSLRQLLKKGNLSVPLRLRMHSHADPGKGLQRWVNRGKESGAFEVSNNASLHSDIAGAVSVIGMSTTVMEEALLMGRPVMQLKHPDYFSYIDLEGISGVRQVAYDELSDELLRSFHDSAKPFQIRERFGLAHPSVNYQHLFLEA